jgi:hypothetical protein
MRNVLSDVDDSHQFRVVLCDERELIEEAALVVQLNVNAGTVGERVIEINRIQGV